MSLKYPRQETGKVEGAGHIKNIRTTGSLRNSYDSQGIPLKLNRTELRRITGHSPGGYVLKVALEDSPICEECRVGHIHIPCDCGAVAGAL